MLPSEISWVFDRRISRNATGTTNIDSSGAVSMPPTIGAAMRCISSEPVPVPHRIGSVRIHAPLLDTPTQPVNPLKPA